MCLSPFPVLSPFLRPQMPPPLWWMRWFLKTCPGRSPGSCLDERSHLDVDTLSTKEWQSIVCDWI